MTRLHKAKAVSSIVALVFFTSVPVYGQQARVTNDPSLNPLVDQKVNLDCVSQEESLAGFRVELRQVNDQFFMNYQDTSYRPVAMMEVSVYQGEDRLTKFEVEGTRRSTNRVFFKLDDANLSFGLNLINLPEGVGSLMLEHVDGLPRSGFFSTAVSCLMTPQGGGGDD